MQGLASSQELSALDRSLDFVALLGKTEGHLGGLTGEPKLTISASAWASVHRELSFLPQRKQEQRAVVSR